MNSNYSRGIDTSNSLVLVEGIVNDLPNQKIFKKFGVEELVRIPKRDYPEHAKKGEVFSHYNLPISPQQIGSKFLLVKIAKNGEFANGEETRPILSLENIYVAKLIFIHTFKDYDHLPKDVFENAIGNVSNKEQLKDLIAKRYLKVLKDSTKEEILKMGFSVRKFEIIKSVSF